MRAAKILAGVVGGIVLLIVVGLLAVWFLVNPSAYKPKIAASVKASTGRELLLPGAIKLSVFPWIALELGPASLGNPPGFDGEPFLAFNRAAVRIRLIPLLHGDLEIGRVEIDGLDVRMRKNAAGKGNWEGFGDDKEAPETPTTEGGYHAAFKSFAGLHVTHGRVSYQDKVVDKIEIETGSFTDRARIPINIGFDLDFGPEEKATVNAKFTFSMEESTENAHFEAVSLSGLASAPGSSRETHWEVTAPAIDVGVKAQTLGIPSFAMTYLGAHVTGKVSGTHFIDDLAVTGSIKLDPLSLREFIPRLGVPVPKVHDARALAQLAASGDFEYDAKGARLPKVEVVLDDTHLHGALALNNGEGKEAAKSLKFDLGVDAIDLNRYMIDSNGAPAKPAAANPDGKPEKPMEADGTLSIASVHFSSLDFTSVRATLASHEGVMRIAPAQALIDGGRYSGDITVDERGAVPVISMDEHLTGVDIAKLMAQGAAKGRVSGHGNVNLKANAHGATGDAVFKTLNGTFDANLAEGALEGIDLGYALAQAESLIEHQATSSVQNAGRTKFDAFKMSAQIANGVATTKDINISSPVLKVTGQGNVNLPTQGVDLTLLATVLKALGKTAVEVPMRITGTYLDPTVRPDLEGLAKSAVKDKLQNVLQDKLKGLFGKP